MQIYVGNECFDIVKETPTRLTDSAGRTWYKPDEVGRLSRYGGKDGIRIAVTAERYERRLKEEAEWVRTRKINGLAYDCNLFPNPYVDQTVTIKKVKAKIESLTAQIAAAKELEAFLES